MVRLTDRPDMTLDVYRGRKTTIQQQQQQQINGAVKTTFDIQVDGKHGPGRPKMTWKQLIERDHREWKLSAIDPHDRDTRRSGVNLPCVQQASCLVGGHCFGYGPCTCMLIKNLMMMMTMMRNNNTILAVKGGKSSGSNTSTKCLCAQFIIPR